MIFPEWYLSILLSGYDFVLLYTIVIKNVIFILFLEDFIVSLDYMLRILMFLCFHFLHFYITFCYLFSFEFYKLISPMLPSYLTKNIRLIGTLFIHSYTHACTVKFTPWLFIINITDGFYSELSCSTEETSLLHFCIICKKNYCFNS